MTHRPIEPIAIPGVIPGGTPRAYPIFEDVDPRTLLVDEGYQRDSSERSMKLVRKIVAGWDWARYKAVDVSEPVLTPSGWKPHGDIQPGETVFGPDGKPTKVLAKTEVFNNAACFRVSFCDGYSVVVSGDHLWTLEIPRRARIEGQAKETRSNFALATLPTWELKRQVDASVLSAARRYPRLAVAGPVQLPTRYLPVDPYVLGVWLGDGATGETRVTAGRQDVVEMTANLEAAGCTVQSRPQRANYRLSIGNGRQGLAAGLQLIGVYKNKHIPPEYLIAAEHQRFALLQGLMDTDGSCSNGRAIFCAANRDLARSTHELVMSLGMRAQLAERFGIYKGEPRAFWQVQFFANVSAPPFRLSRKASAAKSTISKAFRYRRVVAVEPVESRPVSCIRVEREDGLYLVGRHLVATHNCPVAVMTAAGLELIDGQHTAIAAATHPEITTIPVMIVDVAKREERAAAFIGHNKDRVAVTTAQIHVAAIAAGDTEAVAIEEVCAAAGVRTLRAPSKEPQPGETMAIAAIGSVVRGREKVGAIRVLNVAVKAKIAPLTQIEIKAIDLLVFGAEYQGQISDATLVTTISAMGRKAYSEANVFRAAHPTTPLWKALAITWFKARRSSVKPQVVEKSAGGACLRKSAQAPMLISSPSKGAAKINTVPPTEEDRPRVLLPPERAGQSVADAAKHDSRQSLRGWRPGNHLRRCTQCGSPYVGHMRSVECADCAYRAEAVERAS